MKTFLGRTAGRKTSIRCRYRPHFCWPMLLVLLCLPLAACGVKSQLVKPNGQATPKTQIDPSQPPSPIGR